MNLLKRRLRKRGRLKKENVIEGTKLKYILREFHLGIAQLSTARQELPWLHFPLGATLAFLALCAPLSPEEAFWRRPGAAVLASFCVD